MSRKRENIGAKIAKQQRQQKKAQKREQKLARQQGKPAPEPSKWT